ncbi:MAG TPA: hypothetical protein VND22_10220 [Actinomycetota bacterium]|nr:hypothetical protein [Actinomycetota bacterium]
MKLSESAKGWLAAIIALCVIGACVGALIRLGATVGSAVLSGAWCLEKGLTDKQVAEYERKNELLFGSLPFPFGVQAQSFEHLPYARSAGNRAATLGASTRTSVNLPVELDEVGEREVVENWVRDLEGRGWTTSALYTQGPTEGDLNWSVNASKGPALVSMHPSGNQLSLRGDHEASGKHPYHVECGPH